MKAGTLTAVEREVRPGQRLRAALSQRGLYVWLTVLPVLLLVALFTVFPFAHAAWTSTRKVILALPGSTPFIGLENYAQVMGVRSFQVAARNTLVFTVLTVPLVTGSALGVSLLLNQRLKGFGLLRALVILPWAIPLVAVGIMWKLLLHGNFGAFNGLLLRLGLVDGYVAWLSHPNLAMLSVVTAHLWRGFPLPAILFLAALQTISAELYDAANVDGAGPWTRFRYITLPLLKGPLLVVLVFETMLSVAVFDLVFVMTGGGPGSSTTLIAWYAYLSTFRFLNLGHGAALSFLIAAFLLVTIVVYLRLIKVEEAG